MPKNKINHESSRSKVCLICRYKIFKNGRILKNSSNLTCLIRAKYELLSDYDPADMTLPNALCSTCLRGLHNCKTNKEAAVPFLKLLVYIVTTLTISLLLCTHDCAQIPLHAIFA